MPGGRRSSDPVAGWSLWVGEVKRAVKPWQIEAVDEAIERSPVRSGACQAGHGRAADRAHQGARKRPEEHRESPRNRAGGDSFASTSAFSGSSVTSLGAIVALLLISAGKHDPAMELLDRPTFVHEARGQVVEELGVSRRLASQAKIARSRDQGRCRSGASRPGSREHGPSAGYHGWRWPAPARAGRCRLETVSALRRPTRRETAAARVRPGYWDCRGQKRVARSAWARLPRSGPWAALPDRWSASSARRCAALGAWLARGGRARAPGRHRGASAILGGLSGP